MLNDKSGWIATASSVYPNYPANKAIDGAVTQLFDGFFHSHDGDTYPWLQVELDNSYIVMQIDVYNRKDNVNPPDLYDFEFIQV